MKSIYSKDQKELTARIKKSRIEANFTQAKAGKLLDKTQSYISKIESGQRQIDIVELKQFARVYKISLNYLING